MAPNSSKDKSRQTPGRFLGAKVPISSGPLVTLVQRTDALAEGMILVLLHHDAPCHIVRALDEQVHSYLDTSVTEGVWLKRCKYILTYPLAKYLRNELPPSPDMSFRPSGRLRKWMKTRLNGFNPENTHLWYSWLQSKRCTLPVSEEMVEDAYLKHFDTMSQPDPGDLATIDSIMNDRLFSIILREMKCGVTRRLEDELGSFDSYCPKTSASFDCTRGQGGQSNDLRVMCGLASSAMDDLYTRQECKGDPSLTAWNENYKKYRQLCLNVDQELHSMVYRPVVLALNGPIVNFVGVRYCSYGRVEWRVLGDLHQSWIFPSGLNCTIQAVLEPNKIRIISKGEALPYYFVRPLQKAMRETLSDMDWSCLTGRPIDYSDIQRLTESAEPGMEWFSIDYTAATDGLSYAYSRRIFDRIIEDLPVKLRVTAEKVLGLHRLHYPKKGSKPDFRGLQNNGQLMGSVLSFPILCLANLGVYLLATKDEQRCWNMSRRTRHVLVNGDDMVYASRPENWQKHVDIGKKVGLEMSPGKAYVHREYLNINSTSFHCPLYKKTANPSVREIGYLNVGLLLGKHKVQGRKDDGMAQKHTNEEDGIVANINCILKGALPKKKVDVLKWVLQRHSKVIGEECKAVDSEGNSFRRNLFIPQNLGGMGVISPDGWKFKLTKQEIYVAHGYVKQYPDLGVTTQRPLPGYEVDRFEEFINEPWTPQFTEDKRPLRVPIYKVQHKSIRTLCRLGMLRYCSRPGLLSIHQGISKSAPLRSVVKEEAETPVVDGVRFSMEYKAGPGKSENFAIGFTCVDGPKRCPLAGLNSSVLSVPDQSWIDYMGYLSSFEGDGILHDREYLYWLSTF